MPLRVHTLVSIVISVAFGGFFTYQVKEAAEFLLNLLKDYLLQPFFLVGAPNFGPAAAAPAGPAPTALQCHGQFVKLHHHCSRRL